MVEVAICRCGELECPEANVVKGFIIDTERLVRVLDKLVDGERSIVRLHNHKLQKSLKVLERQTSTTVSETAGLGTTEYVHIIRSGYSSLILDIKRVPIPAPVPPPSEWVIWKPAPLMLAKRSDNTTNYVTHPAGNRYPQPPCERHQERSRPTPHPRCNLWVIGEPICLIGDWTRCS